MPKLPQVSGKEVVKALLKEGWYEVGQEGSHVVLKKGTLSGILKTTNLSVDKL